MHHACWYDADGGIPAFSRRYVVQVNFAVSSCILRVARDRPMGVRFDVSVCPTGMAVQRQEQL